mmetsp:Transcript_34085/g.89623  ORF Transcript_34085/g.89623 Transcript_34085/m.89623 type:complete len:222 (+) Transcript_34085:246-911(+)
MLLVEPQPHVASQLADITQQFGGTVAIEQAAICAHDGNVTFYYLPDINPSSGAITRPHLRRLKSFPVATSQLASMSKEHILRQQRHVHNGLKLAAYIRELIVPCYSVPTLLKRHAIRPHKLDVLTVDAEGYDLTILDAVDFQLIAPQLLIWEQVHVNAQPTLGGRNRTASFISKLEQQHAYRCNSQSDLENVMCVKRSWLAVGRGAAGCRQAFIWPGHEEV